MQKGIFPPLCLCACFCLPVSVQANDAVAALGAGGIVLGTTDDIAMEQEDLFISEEKIRVSYIFRNTSDHDIKTRVAFPVPEFPVESDQDLGLDRESQNPMDFSVSVNGKPKSFDTEIKKKDGNVKVTHHWVQTFPAGKTLSVKHVYRPATGGEAQMYFREEDRTAKIEKYCIEPGFAAWIDKINLPEKGSVASPRYVDYILTTGANWKGPIGKFRLTLQKENPEDKLTFCGTGVKKVDARTFVVEKTNFTPEQDLHVMFVHQYRIDQ